MANHKQGFLQARESTLEVERCMMLTLDVVEEVLIPQVS